VTTNIALFGAGGKMGARLSKNLMDSPFGVRHVEPGAAGRQRLKEELGVTTVTPEAALDGADVVILAVPDTLIGKLAALYAQNLDDGVALSAVDQLEALTTGLSRKIWQKVMLLDRVSGESA